MTDEFDPLTGELLPKSTKQSAGATAPKPFLPNLSDEELEIMAIEKLSEALQGVDASRQPDLAVRLANAVLDRIRGKPGQYIHQIVENISKTNVTELSNEQLVVELRKLSAAGGLPDGVLLLEDGTVQIDNDAT